MKRILRRRGHGDEGVTLVEVIFAIGLFALILTTFALLMYSSNKTIREGRERQQANAVGVEALERVRALPLATIRLGLSNSSVASLADPNISGSAGSYTFTDVDGVQYALLTSAYDIPTDPALQHPLAPHVQTIVGQAPASTVYTVKSYPVICYMSKSSQDCVAAKTDPSDVEMIRVVTLVTYTEAQGGQVVTRQFSTSLFNAAGCQLNGQQTFVGPCEPFFNGSAVVTGASIGIAPSTEFSTQLPFGFTRMAVVGGAASASVKQEQVLTVASNGLTGAIEGEGVIASSPAGDFAQSSTDPAKGDAISDSATYSQTVQPVGSIGGAVDAFGEASSSGTLVTALRAQAADNCVNTSGTLQATAQPCASASNSGNAISLTYDLGDGDIVELATIGAPGSPSRTHAAKASSGSTGVCASPSGDGCVEASARRDYGSVTLLKFPADMQDEINDALALDGKSFTGAYLQTGAVPSNSVSAWAGFNGTASPIPNLTAGALTGSYFDGDDTVSGGWSPGQAIPLGDIDTAFDYKGDAYTLEVTGNVIRSANTTEYPASGTDCAASACTYRAVIGSPVAGTYDILMRRDGEVIMNFRITVDLGSTQAIATYQAAQ